MARAAKMSKICNELAPLLSRTPTAPSRTRTMVRFVTVFALLTAVVIPATAFHSAMPGRHGARSMSRFADAADAAEAPAGARDFTDPNPDEKQPDDQITSAQGLRWLDCREGKYPEPVFRMVSRTSTKTPTTILPPSPTTPSHHHPTTITNQTIPPSHRPSRSRSSRSEGTPGSRAPPRSSLSARRAASVRTKRSHCSCSQATPIRVPKRRRSSWRLGSRGLWTAGVWRRPRSSRRTSSPRRPFCRATCKRGR